MSIQLEIRHLPAAHLYSLVETTGAFGMKDHIIHNVWYDDEGQMAVYHALEAYARGFIDGMQEVRKLVGSPYLKQGTVEVDAYPGAAT